MCCSVNGFVCLVCCMFDSVCELFGESICNTFGCGWYFVVESSEVYVCCSECNVVSNECNEPTSFLVQPIGLHGGDVMYFGFVCFRGELGFMNCDDICMCVVNKQFELLKFVFHSIYVDLQYDEISLTFTVGHMSLCL